MGQSVVPRAGPLDARRVFFFAFRLSFFIFFASEERPYAICCAPRSPLRGPASTRREATVTDQTPSAAPLSAPGRRPRRALH
jgi:hypothetical protein